MSVSYVYMTTATCQIKVYALLKSLEPTIRIMNQETVSQRNRFINVVTLSVWSRSKEKHYLAMTSEPVY